MPLVALRFDAPGASADDWSEALLASGAASVDATDASAGTDAETPRYGEPGDVGGIWALCRLTALIADGVDAGAVVGRAAETLGLPVPEYALEVVPDEDWVRRTQEQFGPLRIANSLWVIPSWCAPVDPNAINITLDPGLAFGTGSHPTTRLCLRWLAAHLERGQSMLDYGCGSGILAIAGAKLGAVPVTGTDVDPRAVEASRANAARNGVRAQFVLPGALAPEPVDVLIANILANPLRLLAPALAARVRDGGAIVLSGILEAQAAAVRDEYRRWFKLDAWGSDEGWVALAGRRD
jgi:ribosomal protein L11 methyltransferase